MSQAAATLSDCRNTVRRLRPSRCSLGTSSDGHQDPVIYTDPSGADRPRFRATRRDKHAKIAPRGAEFGPQKPAPGLQFDMARLSRHVEAVEPKPAGEKSAGLVGGGGPKRLGYDLVGHLSTFRGLARKSDSLVSSLILHITLHPLPKYPWSVRIPARPVYVVAEVARFHAMAEKAVPDPSSSASSTRCGSEGRP